MKYEDIVFAWNAQHVNNGPLAGDGRTWDKISDRERIEFALMMATRQEQPIAKIVCGTGGGCSLEFTNGADSLDYAGCDVYLRPPIAQEPHPPTRHCMCDDCAPSFEPTPDGLAPAVTDAMALAFHSAITDSSIGQGEVDEIKTGLRAALCAAKPVEKQEPVGYQALFDAIAAATSVAHAPGINISIEAFTAKIGPLYPAPQPCPECEERKTTALNYISLTFEFEQLQAKCEKLKAERDDLLPFAEVGKSMVELTTTVRGQDEWPAIPELWRRCADERDELAEKLKYASMAATAEAHRCDELAAQVEKMRNPADVLLEIVGRIQPFALPREEDTQQKRYERLRKAYCIAQPWPIPDQACLVWRADLMHMAGDLVHKQAYFDNEKRKRDSALAADMEAGKC